MKLYYAPGTCALACWIALEWTGTDYEVERVDPTSDAYKAVNPLGMVPALEYGGPRPLTQADAVLEYISNSNPEANLGPDPGLEAEALFTETMAFLTGDFHPAFWPYFMPNRFTTDTSKEAIDAVRKSSAARVTFVLKHLENLIQASGHVYGGRRTIADPYAFIMTGWADKVGVPWRSFPSIADFMDRMAADEAVQKVQAQAKKAG